MSSEKVRVTVDTSALPEMIRLSTEELPPSRFVACQRVWLAFNLGRDFERDNIEKDLPTLGEAPDGPQVKISEGAVEDAIRRQGAPRPGGMGICLTVGGVERAARDIAALVNLPSEADE